MLLACSERLSWHQIYSSVCSNLQGFGTTLGRLWKMSGQHCVDVARVPMRRCRDEMLQDKRTTDTAVCGRLYQAVHERVTGQSGGGVEDQEARDAALVWAEPEAEGNLGCEEWQTHTTVPLRALEFVEAIIMYQNINSLTKNK